MNASSTTRIRPGRASRASVAAGCRTDVGLVGLPTTTRSASSGTAAGSSRNPSAARSTTRSTRCPASRRAASGSVNCGCTTTGRTAPRARAISTKASAAPAVSSTRSAGSPCRAATAARAARPSGYAARSPSEAAIRCLSHSGGVCARTLTARSTRAEPASTTSASPWWRRSCASAVATAQVADSERRLGTRSSPPVIRAAASATEGVPVPARTASEGCGTATAASRSAG